MPSWKCRHYWAHWQDRCLKFTQQYVPHPTQKLSTDFTILRIQFFDFLKILKFQVDAKAGSKFAIGNTRQLFPE
jgi:hypothetical protein